MTNPDNPNIINFDLSKQAAGGRHQIGNMAGFRSEQVAGFLLEYPAGFVGIRTLTELKSSNRKLKPLPPDPFRHQDSAIARRYFPSVGDLNFCFARWP